MDAPRLEHPASDPYQTRIQFVHIREIGGPNHRAYASAKVITTKRGSLIKPQALEHWPKRRNAARDAPALPLSRNWTLNVRRSTFLFIASMSLDIPSIQEIDGSGMRFAVIASRYNEALVDSLVRHACATIEAAGAVTPVVERVPGAAELPFAASTIAAHTKFDAIIVIGVVIAGDTNHHEIIGDSTATALLDISIAQKVPVINGILVVNNLAQAEARAGEEINRGKEFAQAALEMAAFTKKWKTK